MLEHQSHSHLGSFCHTNPGHSDLDPIPQGKKGQFPSSYFTRNIFLLKSEKNLSLLGVKESNEIFLGAIIYETTWTYDSQLGSAIDDLLQATQSGNPQVIAEVVSENSSCLQGVKDNCYQACG